MLRINSRAAVSLRIFRSPATGSRRGGAVRAALPAALPAVCCSVTAKTAAEAAPTTGTIALVRSADPTRMVMSGPLQDAAN
jgi:hypothetical protein